MGAWLEINSDIQPNNNNDFYFSFQGYNTPQTIKNCYSDAVRLTVESATFVARNGDHLLGFHSNCKYAVTEVQSSACSKDKVDHNGWWKFDKCQQDTHVSVMILYFDAKFAAKLCKSGAITYQHIHGSSITDELLLRHVVQNIHTHLEREVCMVFGCALLWRIFMKSNMVNLCTRGLFRGNGCTWQTWQLQYLG